MKRVVLVFPNQTELEDVQAYTKYVNAEYRKKDMISLGMLWVAAAVRHAVDLTYIDANILNLSNRQLLPRILDCKPDIVGFGGTFSEWPQARRMSAECRKRGIVTVYGGSNATTRPEKHRQYFDHVVIGRGEEAFAKICGVEARIAKEPARDLAPMEKYMRSQWPHIFPQPMDVVMAAQGCPYDCRFCSSQYIWNRKYQFRPLADVEDEIKQLVSTYGTKSIFFREDNLTINKNYLKSVCNMMSRLNLGWLCQSRVTSIDEQTVRMMKDSGCLMICCGFESANDTTLQYIRKRQTFADVQNAIGVFNKVDIIYAAGLMVGVLNEGEREIRNTLEFFYELRKSNLYQTKWVQRFVGYPVSEMYYEMIEKNLVAYNWQDGELLIPHTRHLRAHEVDAILDEYKGRKHG